MKILVATDGSKHALRAVLYAADLAERLKEPSVITLLSVHDDTALRHAQRFVGRAAVEDYLRELSDNELAEARATLDARGVAHDMVIRTGHIGSEIARIGAEGAYALIILGAKGRSALEDMLIGSVARQVIELSKVPVTLVP